MQRPKILVLPQALENVHVRVAEPLTMKPAGHESVKVVEELPLQALQPMPGTPGCGPFQPGAEHDCAEAGCAASSSPSTSAARSAASGGERRGGGGVGPIFSGGGHRWRESRAAEGRRRWERRPGAESRRNHPNLGGPC